ncbi:hypothetical protein [Stappia stellulata]|uniref:hypothetical protein n=1 Tax=Stappia stellulata TaxID=71235 RepID=UPI00146B3C8D|nr:hypothetical protein [Stappia stellulata]
MPAVARDPKCIANTCRSQAIDIPDGGNRRETVGRMQQSGSCDTGDFVSRIDRFHGAAGRLERRVDFARSAVKEHEVVGHAQSLFNDCGPTANKQEAFPIIDVRV